jgi:hypothetical protein
VTMVNATGEELTTDGVALVSSGVYTTPLGLAGTPIRNRAQSSTACTLRSPRLEPRNAGVGTLQPPRLVSFVATDPDGGDFEYSVGDQLTITFRGRSNRGAHSGGRAFVDSLFRMEPALGDAYSGEYAAHLAT